VRPTLLRRIIRVFFVGICFLGIPGSASASTCVVAAMTHADASVIGAADAAFVGTVIARWDEYAPLDGYRRYKDYYDTFRFAVEYDAYGNLGDEVDVISGGQISQSHSFDVGDRIGLALMREQGHWVESGGACETGADPEEFLDVVAGMEGGAPPPFRGALWFDLAVVASIGLMLGIGAVASTRRIRGSWIRKVEGHEPA
jgi:hypothetical protein